MLLGAEQFTRDVISRLHHQPCYIDDKFTDRIVADLKALMNLDFSRAKDMFNERKADLLLSYGYEPTSDRMDKPFAFADGSAFIPCHGMLINRFSGSYGFVTGYNFIRSQMQAAMADPDVNMMVFDYNTYGGTAAGCVELANEIYESRSVKPSLGIIDPSCYSAGYFLGSQNTQLIATTSAGTGSIGCVSMHVDFSEMLSKEGVKVTLIRSAARKMEGNSIEPLSDAAKKSIQASVDYHASAFIESVARGRGIDEADIRATQAACFDPPEALEKGLIDAVQTPTDALNSFSSSLNGANTMQGQNNSNSASPISLEHIQTTVTGAVSAALPGAIASALPAALAAHDKAKTERRAGITGSDEGKKRPKLAAHLADNTTMTVDDAKAILSNSAEEQPERQNSNRGNSAFHQAMNSTRQPNVGADSAGNGGEDGDGGEGGGETDAQAADRLLTTFAGHTGSKVVNMKKTG